MLSARASFNPKAGTTQSTLSVTYADDGVAATGDEGDVTSPDPTDIDCGNASGGTNCTWVVPTGSTLTVFQTPATGNIFLGWGGECSGKAVSCTVQLNQDRQVGAAWAPAAGSNVQLTVNITGSGSVSGGGDPLPGHLRRERRAEQRGRAQRGAGRRAGVHRLERHLGCSGTNPSCTLTMDAAKSVTATFAPANTLTVNLVGNGNVSGGSGAINCGLGATICSANFAANASVTLVASPGNRRGLPGLDRSLRRHCDDLHRLDEPSRRA